MDIMTGSDGVIVITYEQLSPQEAAQFIGTLAADLLPLTLQHKVKTDFISWAARKE